MHQPFGAPAPKPVSVPRSHAKHPTDTYPDASEVTIRKAISAFLPRFKDKDLFNRSLCWCTDTADANLLITEDPRWKNLILATGDSGYVRNSSEIDYADLLQAFLQAASDRKRWQLHS